MTWFKRLPAGDILIDLRAATPGTFVDGTVFSEVARDLSAVDAAPALRIWVLHDAAVEWCTSALQLEAGLSSWLRAASACPASDETTDVVVVSLATAKSETLVSVLHALDLEVHPCRAGGGLPVDAVNLDGKLHTVITTRALPEVAPLPMSLEPALERVLGV